MTVISAMKFNSEEGAIIADEQSSNQLRKKDFATKLKEYNNSNGVLVISGGSGLSDLLYYITERVESCVNNCKGNIKQAKHIALILDQELANAMDFLRDGCLKAKINVSLSEFQSRGKYLSENEFVKLPDSIIEIGCRILDSHEFQEWLSTGFVIFARDCQGVGLYALSNTVASPLPVAQPYQCIGSGSDMADAEWAAFVDLLPRDKRNNIKPLEGIAALIYATERAARRNVGVGGTPFIGIITSDGTSVYPDENESRLAAEIVRGTHARLLPKSFQYEALEKLIYHKNYFSDIEEEMRDRAGKKSDKLSLLLRNYKV